MDRRKLGADVDTLLTFRDSAKERRTLPPNVFLERAFNPLTGTGEVTVKATARTEDLVSVHDAQTGIDLTLQDVTVHVTVLDPEGSTVVDQPMPLPRPGVPGPAIEFLVPEALEAMPWRLQVRNVGDKEILCEAVAEVEDGRVLLHGTAVPLRVLNHALRQLLLGVAVAIRVDGSTAVISFSPDLAVVLGSPPEPIRFDLPASVARDINLTTLTAQARTSGGASDSFSGAFIRLFLEFETVGDTELHIGPIDLVDLTKATIEIDIQLRTTAGRRGRGVITPAFSVRTNITGDTTRLGALAAAAFGTSFDEIVEALRDGLTEALRDEAAPLLSPYLTEGFLQLASRTDVLHDLVVEGGDFVVRHFDPDFRPQPGGADADTPLLLDPVEGVDPTASDPTGGGPSFKALQRDISTIVVLMQENRSFDHLLGHLSLEAGRADVEGLSGEERNEAPGDLVNDINHIENTRFALSPAHEHDPVMAQVAEGQMSGFLASFVERYPTAIGLGNDNPGRQSPMSFYGAEQLPTFTVLAEHFLVCDRWFCSFPGATQPNRFCTLTGATPSLNNLEADDPRIGYLTERTIFDALPDDVDWVYYEHDVAFLRLYDRYRLDNRHIIPFDDPRDGFHHRAAAGTLPPIVFIDPDFVDVPFGRTANDDHPPADLADGQHMIGTIYNRLISSPQWANMLFLITYDEHGGYFDHVPPPGSLRADEEAIEAGEPPIRVRPAHPEGPAMLGVRVPTFVVSPWVAAGQTSELVFDHTAIGKTILLRFRGPDAPLLSRRMRGARHLGQVLQDQPRTDFPFIDLGLPPADRPPEEEAPPDGQIPFAPGARFEKDEFHEAVRRFGQPVRR